MLEVAALTYGMLLSFVLTGASRNRKLQRPNPAVLNHIGYVLFGMTCAVSAMLTVYALWGVANGAAI